MSGKPRLSRPRLGKYFSEGARQLWLAMSRMKLSQTDVARQIGTSSGQVSQWLYGGRRASLRWALTLEKELGIAASDWARTPVRPLEPPAARAA